MRIGTSRADWLGFWVFVALAAILGTLLITSLGGGGGETELATQQFVDLGAADEPAEPVPTTPPVPTAAPTPTSTPWPTATPEPTATPTSEPTATPEPATSTSSGSSTSAGSSNATAATQAAPTAVPNAQATAPTAVPNAVAAAPSNLPAPNASGGTFTYTLTAKVAYPSLHLSAGGPAFTPAFNGTALPATNPTVFGNPLVYPVIAGTPDNDSGWAQVQIPGQPNGSTAWVQTSQFQWGSSNRMIRINVANNTVTVFEGNQVLLTTDAVTGKQGVSPTPLATGWVEEIMPGPSAAYGPTLISLGLFSDSLSSFGGSPLPKIALHGTNRPDLMGEWASNGCVRVPNNVITQIAQMVSTGSRVQIVSG